MIQLKFETLTTIKCHLLHWNIPELGHRTSKNTSSTAFQPEHGAGATRALSIVGIGLVFLKTCELRKVSPD